MSELDDMQGAVSLGRRFVKVLGSDSDGPRAALPSQPSQPEAVAASGLQVEMALKDYLAKVGTAGRK
eukprot:5129363-Amphidinium_carterae.1